MRKDSLICTDHKILICPYKVSFAHAEMELLLQNKIIINTICIYFLSLLLLSPRMMYVNGLWKCNFDYFDFFFFIDSASEAYLPPSTLCSKPCLSVCPWKWKWNCLSLWVPTRGLSVSIANVWSKVKIMNQ